MVKATPPSSGSRRAWETGPSTAMQATVQMATPTTALRYKRAVHSRAAAPWPKVVMAVIRRTTLTRRAEPGIDSTKKRPRSWAIPPY